MLKRIMTAALAAVMTVNGFTAAVLADSAVPVDSAYYHLAQQDNLKVIEIAYSYNQIDARSELVKYINEFRAEKNKTVYNGYTKEYETVTFESAPLTYDYELEKLAMTRAAEEVLIYGKPGSLGHNRLAKNLDIKNDVVMADGECLVILGKNSTAQDAYRAFLEENYTSQPHRMTMIDPTFTSIGIGHIQQGAFNVWVVDFAEKNSGAAETPARSGMSVVEIPVDAADYDMYTEKYAALIARAEAVKAEEAGADAEQRAMQERIERAVTELRNMTLGLTPVEKEYYGN